MTFGGARPALGLVALAAAGCAGAPARDETPAATAAAPAWRPLVDPATLAGITPLVFGGDGSIDARDGAVVLEPGSPLTGFRFDAVPDAARYELEVIAARLDGHDFFCGLTFPVGADCLTLVLGGWGGTVCGLSSLDGDDAANNGTRTLRHFARGRDYTIALRVTPARVEVAIDGAPFLAADLAGRALSLRPEVELCRPFGYCNFATRARVRSVRWRPLPD